MKVVELFCGSGNFTSVYAGRENTSIVAAECNEQAIKTLEGQNWNSVEAYTVDLFDEHDFRQFLKRCKDMDILIIDPPRAGMKVKRGLFAKSVAPEWIIYISCDLATFCRDLADFKQEGYDLESLQPIDLFPQTPHVELLSLMKKK